MGKLSLYLWWAGTCWCLGTSSEPGLDTWLRDLTFTLSLETALTIWLLLQCRIIVPGASWGCQLGKHLPFLPKRVGKASRWAPNSPMPEDCREMIDPYRAFPLTQGVGSKLQVNKWHQVNYHQRKCPVNYRVLSPWEIKIMVSL